jgi:hypothetical protein
MRLARRRSSPHDRELSAVPGAVRRERRTVHARRVRSPNQTRNSRWVPMCKCTGPPDQGYDYVELNLQVVGENFFGISALSSCSDW